MIQLRQIQKKMKQIQKVKINLAELYPAQLAIFSKIIKNDSFYNIVNGSRQVGKSILLINLALYFALSDAKSKVLVISPVDSQVKKLYTDIIITLGPAAKVIVKSKRGSGGSAQIVMNNGSTILFRSAKSGDAIRGNDPSYILADEAAFIQEEVWSTAIEPALSTKGKKVVLVSTPRGNNYFKKLWAKGHDKSDNFYQSFKITYKDNPFANLQFINKQREELADDIFNQEYLGIFMDSTSIFKDVRSRAVLKKSQPGIPCLMGIDVAFKKDYFVCSILDNNGNMLDYLRFNQTDTQTAVANVMAFYRKWTPLKVIIEVNNQGLPMFDLLRAAGIYNLQAFDTTSKSKGELINKLMADFNSGKIKLLNDEVVISEFEAFTYALTKNGNITFSAAYGHDDIVMATAFANYAKKYTGGGLIID